MKNKKILSLIVVFSIILGIAAPVADVAFAQDIKDPEVKEVQVAISRFRKAHSIHDIDEDYINKVEDATAKYNELTAAQKEELKGVANGYHVRKLDEANAKIVNLYISRFKKSTKVDEIDEDYIAKATKAVNAYDALTPGGKEALKKMDNGYHVRKLEDARAKLDKVVDPEVQNVLKLISAFSKSTKVEDIDQDYIDKVMAAKEAYDALTPAQKELVAAENKGYHVDKLEDAVRKINALKGKVVEVDAIETTEVEVPFGTSAEDAIAELDATVEGKLEAEEGEEAETVEIAIEWVAPEDYDAEVANEYVFTGTLVEPEGYVFDEELETEVTAKVTVLPDELQVVEISAINPTTIKVVFNQEVEELVRTDVVVRNVKTSDRQYVKEVKLAEDKKSAEVVFYDALVTKNTYKVVVDEAEKEFDYVVGDAAKIEAETVQIVKPITKSTNLKDVVEFKVLDANGLDITDITEVEFESTASTDGKTIAKLDAGKQTFVYVVVKDKDGKELAKSGRITVKAEVAKAVKLLDYAVADSKPNFEKNEIVKTVRSDDKAKSLFLNLEDQFGKSIVQDGVKFESLNKEVALVDRNNGEITPLKVGTVDVRVTIGDVNEIIQITVEEAAKVASIELDKAEINLSDKLAEGQDVKVTVKDQYGKAKKVSGNIEVKVTEGEDLIGKLSNKALSNASEAKFDIKPVEGKEGKAVVEFSLTVGKDTFKTTLTVNVAKADVTNDFVVEGFEKELDKYDGKDKKNITSMTLRVFGVDANGVKTGEVDKPTIELYKGEDKVTEEVALSGKTINATKLEKDTEYKVVVKVGTLTIFEDTFTVVDTSPAEVEPVVEQIGNKITIESLNHDVDVNEALKALFEIDGKALTNEEVYVYSSDNMSVVKVTEGTATALKNGEATLVISKVGDNEVDNMLVTVEVEAPVVTANAIKNSDGDIVLTAKVESDDLYRLEIDHNLEDKLPEFKLYAFEDDVWGDADQNRDQEDARSTLKVEAKYNADTQTWVFTIKNSSEAGSAMKLIEDNGGKIDFYLVAHENDGNTSGHMGTNDISSNYLKVVVE